MTPDDSLRPSADLRSAKKVVKTINAFASIKEMDGSAFEGKRSSGIASSEAPRFAYFSIDHIALALGIRQKPLPSTFYDLFDPSEIFLENAAASPSEDLNDKNRKEKEKREEVAEEKSPDIVALHGRDAKDHRDGFQKKKLVKVYRSISEVMGGECFTLFVNPKSNVSISYRFLDSIFTIIYGAMGPENLDSYMMMPSHEKQNLFTEWIKKLITEFIVEESETGGTYYAFNYAKNRGMKRENVMLCLNQALQNRCDPKIFHTLIQYTVDMMNISLVIFNMKPPHIDFEKSEVYHYKNIYNPLNPLAILIYDNGIYYPVLRGNQKLPILQWYCSIDGESEGDRHTQSVINKIYKYMKMEDAQIFIKKIAEKKSLDDLRSICSTNEVKRAKIDDFSMALQPSAPLGAKKVDNGSEGSTESRIKSSLWENLRSTADADIDADIDADDSEVDLESCPMVTTDSLDVLRRFQEERAKLDPHKAAFTSGIFQGISLENAFPVIPSTSKPPLIKSVKVEKKVEKPVIPTKASLEKMLKDQLEELCNQNGVSIQKKSEKTGKMIAKTKTEIITDLLAL